MQNSSSDACKEFEHNQAVVKRFEVTSQEGVAGGATQTFMATPPLHTSPGLAARPVMTVVMASLGPSTMRSGLKLNTGASSGGTADNSNNLPACGQQRWDMLALQELRAQAGKQRRSSMTCARALTARCSVRT